jgi:hypothetical protein
MRIHLTFLVATTMKIWLGGNTIIGMDFISFLILLVVSVMVSGILHYGLEWKVRRSNPRASASTKGEPLANRLAAA